MNQPAVILGENQSVRVADVACGLLIYAMT